MIAESLGFSEQFLFILKLFYSKSFHNTLNYPSTPRFSPDTKKSLKTQNTYFIIGINLARPRNQFNRELLNLKILFSSLVTYFIC